MVSSRSKTRFSASKHSPKDNVPAETTPTETEISKSVVMDIPESMIVSQGEYEVQTTLKQVESENLAIVVSNSEAKECKIDAAEEEIMVKQSAEEVGGGKGGEEGYFDDADNVADEENYDDDEDEGGDKDDFDDDDASDEDDYDDGYNDEENDSHDDDYGEEEYMMEEEIDEYAKEENEDNAVQEDEDYQEKAVEEEIKEETGKEEKEEREGRSLKQKVKTLSTGSKRKKVTRGNSNEVASKGEDKQEGGQDDAIKEKDAQEEIGKKGEGSSMQKVKKLRNRSRTKEFPAGGSEKVAIKLDDKLESQRRKKSFKKVASMGMIFMCSSKTKVDCYRYKVLGLPASKRDIVGKIYKGMRLFLYDVDLKLMYGIYKAAGRGSYNIQPKAFNSQFPSQVRFTVLEDCLPLAEEKFKKVIQDNYFTRTKFDCQLTSKQVKNLCKLFLAAGKAPLGRSLRAQTHTSADRHRSRARSKERGSALEEKCRHHEYPRRREREVVTSHLDQIPRLPPLPLEATRPSYLYNRTLEMDAYRRDLLVVHRDPCRELVSEPRDILRLPPSHLQATSPAYIHDRTFRMDACRRDLLVVHTDPHREPVLEPRDAYRPAPLLQHRDVHRQEPPSSQHDLLSQYEIGRYDPFISHRDRLDRRHLWSRDENGRNNFYISYGERTRINPHITYRERHAYGEPLYRDRDR